MSGEMNTSLANTWTNMMISYFLVIESGSNSFKGVFEGDDGVNDCSVLPTSAQYAELGAVIKIQEVTDVSEASFCGNVFDPIALDNVTDPREPLMSFGWTKAIYRNSSQFKKKYLLRAKAMSLLYEYPGCPILRSLARYGLRMTNDIPKRKLNEFIDKHYRNSYERDLWNVVKDASIVEKEIHYNSRILVQKLYGISVDEQFRIERYLDSLDSLTPLVIPSVSEVVHQDCRHYFNSYCIAIPDKESYNDCTSRFVAYREPIEVPIGNNRVILI